MGMATPHSFLIHVPGFPVRRFNHTGYLLPSFLAGLFVISLCRVRLLVPTMRVYRFRTFYLVVIRWTGLSPILIRPAIVLKGYDEAGCPGPDVNVVTVSAGTGSHLADAHGMDLNRM